LFTAGRNFILMLLETGEDSSSTGGYASTELLHVGRARSAGIGELRRGLRERQLRCARKTPTSHREHGGENDAPGSPRGLFLPRRARARCTGAVVQSSGKHGLPSWFGRHAAKFGNSLKTAGSRAKMPQPFFRGVPITAEIPARPAPWPQRGFAHRACGNLRAEFTRVFLGERSRFWGHPAARSLCF
jgi:hypothetical protein